MDICNTRVIADVLPAFETVLKIHLNLRLGIRYTICMIHISRYIKTFLVTLMDKRDVPKIYEVDFQPYHMNNLSVLGGGKCPPGWDAVAGTCYMYVGAPMTYEQARLFCLVLHQCGLVVIHIT
ncbi:hypothetical protein RR48_05421 [Papilio machaon]|uniref:Uncharacterized protein n=1 Tax=Papilio machaon TaxID=76193 RepID=A0A0N1PGI2_PAPMA|nr:hypothetical protein RR48_05421 [Papilio machaon]